MHRLASKENKNLYIICCSTPVHPASHPYLRLRGGAQYISCEYGTSTEPETC